MSFSRMLYSCPRVLFHGISRRCPFSTGRAPYQECSSAGRRLLAERDQGYHQPTAVVPSTALSKTLAKSPSEKVNLPIGARSFTSDGKSVVRITYVEADETEKHVDAEIGKNLLEVAHENNVELEGACGGELACSTCHLIFEKHIYDSLPPKTDEEEDMLDLAYEVTETSRLGCQIKVKPEFNGMKVVIPDDGF